MQIGFNVIIIIIRLLSQKMICIDYIDKQINHACVCVYRTWWEGTLVPVPLVTVETTASWILTSVPGIQTVGTTAHVRWVWYMSP